MKSLIMASTEQYGYLTDTYKYCINIKDKYKVTYICFDNNLEKIETKGIDIIYLKKSNNLLFDLIRYNLQIVKSSYTYNPYLIFSVYNPLNFISRILTLNKRMILDIRTGDVNRDEIKRKKANARIKLNSLFFKDITIISDSLANLLKIKRYKVLPLGTDLPKECTKKQIDDFNLLYIGVLSNRDIEKTVDAVELFSKKYGDRVSIKYNIIGYFSDENSMEAQSFFKKVRSLDNIFYLGRKKHSEIREYLKNHNIGISFVPITEYYNCQPPTKTFEYLSEGLVTIATNTYENRKIINEKNGVLCQDSPQSFYKALEDVYIKRKTFKSHEIISSVKPYDWKSIIDNILIPMIENNK